MTNGLADLVSDDPRVSVGRASWASSPPILRAHHAGNRIHIGQFCCLGQNVAVFAGGNHPMHQLTQHHLKLYLGVGDFAGWSAACPDNTDITTIGNDVWLGDGCLVLSGVTVGDGAVIGARAVVSRDVPPYAIVAGNPASVIRNRFPDETISRLLQLRWWDWPREDLVACADTLFSDDIDGLAAYAEMRGLPGNRLADG